MAETAAQKEERLEREARARKARATAEKKARIRNNLIYGLGWAGTTVPTGVTPPEHALDFLGVRPFGEGVQGTLIEELDRLLEDKLGLGQGAFDLISQGEPRDPAFLQEILAGDVTVEDIIDNVMANGTSIAGVTVSAGPWIIAEHGEKFDAIPLIGRLGIGATAKGFLNWISQNKDVKEALKEPVNNISKNMA